MFTVKLDNIILFVHLHLTKIFWLILEFILFLSMLFINIISNCHTFFLQMLMLVIIYYYYFQKLK